MTENEAKNVLENVWDFAICPDEESGDILEKAIDIATHAFEKLEKIEELGTVEELKVIKETTFSGLELLNIYVAFKKLANYEAIGNMEKLQVELEKRVPKKPNIWGDGYDDKGNMIYDIYDCPNCGKSYEIDYEKHDYCPNCGQAIDFSEVEE